MDNEYEENIYAIVDLDGYATQMREAAAKSISDTDDDDNLDEYITVNEIIRMVKDGCLGFDEDNRPLLDEETNETIFENTVTWIHEIGLAKLAAQDLVECAWDNEINDMIFWKKENNNESKSRRKNKKS